MEPEAPFSVVTGAFGYSGRYLTERLLALGESVLTLTGHPNRPNPFGERVRVAPFDFDRPDALAMSLRGAEVLYNTYWVRFPYRGVTYEQAVENTCTLIGAAVRAGLRRIVHVSIANPSADAPWPYYRGKAQIEQAITESGLSYAILRPTVLFGGEDILINNIAWTLRRLPVVLVPGSGDYRLRPIFVEDLADLAVEQGHRTDSVILDAVGPESYSYNELLRLLADVTGRHPWTIHVPPRLVYWLSLPISWLMRDVLLTLDELEGLVANVLSSDAPATGQKRLSEWLAENRETVGKHYASELKRRR